MKIHNYSKYDGKLLYSEIAEIDPLEPSKFLIPANSTTIEPLEDKEGFDVVFNGEVWEYKKQHVKVTAYNKETKQSKEFDDESLVGDEYTALEPLDNSIWVESEWVVQEDLVEESNRIKAKSTRDNAVSANITVHGADWQVANDAEDIRKVIGDAETISASEDDTIMFRLADNSWRETTLSELRDVLKANIARKQDVWNQMAVWDSGDKQEPFEVK